MIRDDYHNVTMDTYCCKSKFLGVQGDRASFREAAPMTSSDLYIIMIKNNLVLLQGAPLLANSFYPAKSVSEIYRRYFSSNSNKYLTKVEREHNLVLQPWSVTGLVDAEGSFMIR